MVTGGYQRGDGADILIDSAEWRWDAEVGAWRREGNVLSLGAGIAASDMTPRLDRDSGRIVLDLGDGDRIDIGPPHDLSIQTMRFADGSALTSEDFFTQRPIEVSGTAKQMRFMKSRRWRHGERSLRAANNTTWRKTV